MTPEKAKIIAIEGPDMVGKATQARLLAKAFEDAGATVTIVDFPHPFVDSHGVLRSMLSNGLANAHPEAIQTLQLLNRIEYVRRQLPSISEAFETIIMDRWLLSSYVYDEAAGTDLALTKFLAKDLPEADLYIVLDGEPWPKEETDAYESNTAFQRRVRQLYQKYCQSDPSRYVKIDSHRPAEEVHRDILALVMSRKP